LFKKKNNASLGRGVMGGRNSKAHGRDKRKGRDKWGCSILDTRELATLPTWQQKM
jgi:hypothetical protein